MYLKVKIQTPQEIVYEGEAISISTSNGVGKFDILENHANFISVIKDNITIIKPDKEKIDLSVSLGVVKCLDNYVLVFLGLD